MTGRNGRKALDEIPLVVELTCRWCGRPITLTASGAGQQVPDVEAFLATHRRCLERAASEARELEPPDDPVVGL